MSKDEERRGPRAPKDPTKKRSCIYILLDQMIQGTLRASGKYSAEIYLDGERLRNKAQIVGGMKAEDKIMPMLGDSQQFKKLVHSVGVTISDCGDVKEVTVGLVNYGKVERGHGSVFKLNCPVDGAEHILDLHEEDFWETDDIVGQLFFVFPKASCTAKTTVKLYLNDGYEVPEIDVDPAVAWDSEAYRKLVNKSLTQAGNGYRIQKLIQKAQSGADVTIAFLGGSITQGAGAVPINTECYAYRTFSKFRDTYCKNPEKCHYIKAGIGGTSSELGLVRCEQDIEDYGNVEPDMVIVEFAVNDSGDETNGIAHESLIYRLLSKPYKPAVIMLFSIFADDWNLQERLQPIGERYNIPMVSLSDALVEQFALTKEQGNVITKRQYFYDIFHPTNAGHRVMSDSLWHAMEVAAETGSMDRNEKQYLQNENNDIVNDRQDIDLLVDPVIGRQFANVRFTDRKRCERKEWKAVLQISEGGFTNIDTQLQSVERNMDRTLTSQFVNNWMHTTETGIEPFTVTYEGKALFLLVKDSDQITFGKADIYVDDEKVRTFDPLDIGWPHCNAILVQEGKHVKKHVVRVQMAEGEVDKKFTILGLSVVTD